MKEELSKRVKLMKVLAVKAGKKIIDPNLFKVKENKKGNQDISTLGDMESEKIIVGEIKKNFPKDKILSEEGSPEEQIEGFEGFVWVIDPIDGTINYARNRKSSAVSIGVAYKEEAIAGAIYNPYQDGLFWASKGEGAYLGNDKIHVSNIKSFRKAICLTDNGYYPEDIKINLRMLMEIPDFERIGVTGCAAIHYAEVASGRADFYLHTILKPWDNAAGFVIVREAGGEVKGLNGEKINFLSPGLVAGNPSLLKEYFKTKTSN